MRLRLFMCAMSLFFSFKSYFEFPYIVRYRVEFVRWSSTHVHRRSQGKRCACLFNIQILKQKLGLMIKKTVITPKNSKVPTELIIPLI